MSGYRIALAGNPNCGKTSLFNGLTGSSQRVGNWPGVTVECKQGAYTFQDESVAVVDLPGVYTLMSYQLDGAVDAELATGHLLSAAVDVVVNVVDASNLERHLLLTTQLLDLGIPVVVAVNMMDILARRGGRLDTALLAAELGCPVVGIVANQGHNLVALQQAIATQAQVAQRASSILSWPTALREAHAALTTCLADGATAELSSFQALQVLEGDCTVLARASAATVLRANTIVARATAALGEGVDLLLADQRYTFAARVARLALGPQSQVRRKTLSDRIDQVVLHRWLGFPVFFLLMYALFFFAINVGGAFQDFFDLSSSAIAIDGLTALLQHWHCPAWLIALLADGFGKGINTTVTFIPMIAALFLFLSCLEDSGYMARAAFLMDRLMRGLGLPGESFVPMIVGFGCNVPAVMGARTLATSRERILAVVMMPFMSCGARFAIFTVFAAAFFPDHAALLLFGLYFVGIAAAIVTGLLFRRVCLPGAVTPLIMELPSYHVPQLSSLLRLTGRRVRAFVTRAGKVIIPICVVLGGLNALSVDGRLLTGEASEASVLSWVGKQVTPVFAPMGIKQENWPAAVGLMTGVLAKEVVIGTLNTLYTEQAHRHPVASDSAVSVSAGLAAAWQSVPDNLRQLAGAWRHPVQAAAADVPMSRSVLGTMVQQFGSHASAFAYCIFVLLYFPCVSTLAVMRREIGRRWATLSMLWTTGFAYAVAVICYQVLMLSELGGAAVMMLGMIVGGLFAAVMCLRYYANRRLVLEQTC